MCLRCSELEETVRRLHGERCDVCGAKILGPCVICGAPQCCVQCCKIEMFKERAEAAEARCTKYTTEIAGLHEKLEAAEAKLAKAMKVVEAMDQVINICHTALIQIEGHHGCTAITERARVSISKLDSLHEFDEETL